MSQILRFSQQSEISFLQRNRVYEEMNLLLFKLREKNGESFIFV